MKKHKIAIAALLFLIVVYAAQTLVPDPDAEALSKYNLTANSARALSLTFVVPLVAIWSIAMYGYIQFRNYASSIHDTRDGAALVTLSHGILALALWIPAYAVIQNTARDLAQSVPGLTEEVVIATNLVQAVLLLVVSYLLWRGSRRLLDAANIKPKSIKRTYLYITAGIFTLIFGYLVLFNPTRFSPPENPFTAFYLPSWLLVICVILPYAAVWYLGLEAVRNMYIYQRRVKGIVYKKALSLIASGIAFAVISALTLRTLSGLTAWMGDLTLKVVLIMLYGLIVIIGIGYILLWFGSKKLQLIEDV